MIKLRVTNEVMNSECSEDRMEDFWRIYSTKAFQKMFFAESYYELMRRLEKYVDEDDIDEAEKEAVRGEEFESFSRKTYEFSLIHSALTKFFVQRYRYDRKWASNDEYAIDEFDFNIEYSGMWEMRGDE